MAGIGAPGICNHTSHLAKQEAKDVAFTFIRNQIHDLSIALQENFEDVSEEVADEVQAEILAQFDHCFGQTSN